MAAATTTDSLRVTFLKFLFADNEGVVCIATQHPKKGKASFKQSFYRWPQQTSELAAYVAQMSMHHNVWFCINLLSQAERKKEFCLPTNLVWADLDECDPEVVQPTPPVVIETSPGRFQAIWRLEHEVDPDVAESYSRRIAYKYAQNGADPSGWDLTQLLRVPFTSNFKYGLEGLRVPEVTLLRGLDTYVPAELFEAIAKPEGVVEPLDEEQPTEDELPSVEAVIYKYNKELRSTRFDSLYNYEPRPEDDWSKLQWGFINVCLEAGMSQEETYAVVLESNFNKYKRDKRPMRLLWREVVKADTGKLRLEEIAYAPLKIPDIHKTPTGGKPSLFVDNYVEWATAATDAVPEYHELCAFMALSSVLAGNIKVETSYGDIWPNLWGLILGDSTLTRKSTAMRMTMDLVAEVDEDALLATDGSAEGLLTGLSTRPNRTSVFFKDEVSGFFHAINKKDYLAGMPETLTQLYDVPSIYTRRLRKETITISHPVFIFFGGGIRDKVYQLTDEQYVLSGFLPRFLVVSGDADLEKIRSTGPAGAADTAKRTSLVRQLKDVQDVYVQDVEVKIGKQVIRTNKAINATLSKKAWAEYQAIEMEMVKAADASTNRDMALPTFERLSRSLLKMASLVGAVRQEPNKSGRIEITEKDIQYAAEYVQKWGAYSIDLIMNAGKGVNERLFERALKIIFQEPGIYRGHFMQLMRLSKREADDIVGTLIDRGQVQTQKEGKGTRMWPTGL